MKTVNRIQENLSHDPERSGFLAEMIIPDDYMTLINRDYVHEFASDIYCSNLGMARQDIVHTPVANVWGCDIFDTIIKKSLDKCFAGERAQYEGWMEIPSLGHRYCHFFTHPYTNEQGKVTHAAVSLRDDTERKIEEEELRKSEAHFRETLKKMHFGVYSFDMEGQFTFVNDVVVERTGYSREWFTGKSLFDFVRPEERDEVLKHFETSIRGVPVPPYEFAYYKASGETSWVQVNTTPMWKKGRIIGVLGVLLDTTKRKEAEEALEESEEKYRRLFEDSGDAIFITNRKGRLTDVNGSFLDLFGYSKEEAIGLDVIETYVNHEDRETCVRVMNENGFAKDYELKLKKKDGTVIDCLLTGTARRVNDGTILSYQGVVRDESGRKRALEGLLDTEHKLKSVVNGSPVPQFIIDKNHTVTHWNRALEKVTEIKAEDVLGTKQHWKAFYRIERPCAADLLVDEAESELPLWYDDNDGNVNVAGGEYKIVHFFPDLGVEGKWLHFTTAAIKDSVGNLIGAVETLQDITERRLAEDTIQKTQERCRRILETVSPR
jgi:PAS domain S-box-containing protein